MTISGKQNNTDCTFPFVYKQILYHYCTTIENDGTPWCATETDRNNKYIVDYWGNCAEQCPVEHSSGSSRYIALDE